MFDTLRKLRTHFAQAVMPKPKAGEKTGTQDPNRKRQALGAVATDNSQLVAPKPATITTWRAMRNQPTIALARAVANGPIRQAKFTVEADDGVPEDRIEFIQETWDRLERQTIHDLLYSRDYGWQAFEKVFEQNPESGMQELAKLKMLLPELTSVVLKKATGVYNGLLNGKRSGGLGMVGGNRIPLPPEKTFWFTGEREGSNWYGESEMERARSAYNNWLETDARSNRYMTSVAGPIPMVQYPEGEAEDATGQQISNFTIATNILEGLSKCKGVAMPNIIAAYADQLANAGADPTKLQAWSIGFVEASGQHGQEFLDQKRAYETDMMRAWLVPERTATEGTHGTKAESETQGDLVIVTAETILADMVLATNRWVIDQLLVLNYGMAAKGTVRIVVEEIDREKKKLLQAIIQNTLGNPTNVDLLLDLADMEAIFDLVGLPPAQDVADSINRIDEGAAAATLLPGTTEGETMTDDERQAAAAVDDVVPEQALNGAQVKEAKQIVLDVIAGILPKETAKSMLVTFFNMTPEAAESILAKVTVNPASVAVPSTDALARDDAGEEGEPRGFKGPDGWRYFVKRDDRWCETELADGKNPTK